jgi:spoIIIJ-associated protein
MESLEVRAKTVEEATLRALEQLGLTRDEVRVVVIKEGRGGILGLGAEDAVVRVTPLKIAPPPAPVPAAPAPQPDDTDKAVRETLAKVLELLGLHGTIESRSVTEEEGGQEAGASALSYDITGEDLGILIGRRGQTLAALQYLVRMMINRRTDKWSSIVIDVEGYKQRRSQALRSFALDMAERVKARKAPFTLEPMPPYERRIIHMALADNAHVFTESVGQGDDRKVVIRPKK